MMTATGLAEKTVAVTPVAETTVTLSAVVETTVASNRLVCPKCAVDSTGTLSCCFPGGSWYGKCGHEENATFPFNHTWSEGLESCEGKLPSVITRIYSNYHTVGVGYLHPTKYIPFQDH